MKEERYTVIFEDVFVAIPNSAKSIMVDFYQAIGNGLLTKRHWERYLAQHHVSPKPSLFSTLENRFAQLSGLMTNCRNNVLPSPDKSFCVSLRKQGSFNRQFVKEIVLRFEYVAQTTI